MDSRVWHWLHLAISTTCRRFTTGDPSTLKYITLLSAPYCVESCCTVPGRIVSERRASTPTAKVPVAFAGMGCVNVYVQVPSPPHFEAAAADSLTYPGLVTSLPKLVYP